MATIVRPPVLFSFCRCFSCFWVRSFWGLFIVLFYPLFRLFGLIPCRQSRLSGILTAWLVAQLCTDFDSRARGNRGPFVLLRRAQHFYHPLSCCKCAAHYRHGPPRLRLAPCGYILAGFAPVSVSLSSNQRTAFFPRPKRWAVSMFQFAGLQIKWEPVTDRRRPTL